MTTPPPTLLDHSGRPMASLSGLAKEQRLVLQGGDLGYYVASTASGKTVTLSSSLTISAVWACISRSAQVMSTLPLDVYRKGAGGREKLSGDLDDLISISPNDDQTAIEFWGGQLAWLLTTGNAYAEIVRAANGRPIALLPIASTHIRPIRNRETRELFYEARDWDVSRPRVLKRDQVLHLRGWGFGGDQGLSPIQYGTQSLGAAIAADEASGKMFGAGLQASGALKLNQKLLPHQRAEMQQIMESYAGSTRAGKLMILEAGMEFQPLTMNPDDAQMLETRRFSIEEVCRWFGVPPIVIGHSADGQTMWGSGVEQIFLSWMTLGINPVLTMVEKRLIKQLIPRHQWRDTYIEFNREALMQMDSGAKSEFLRSMTSNGIMTRDEARDKLNLPRRGGVADELMVQTAMSPIDNLQKGA